MPDQFSVEFEGVFGNDDLELALQQEGSLVAYLLAELKVTVLDSEVGAVLHQE